ncbi:MAG: hypothetical protein IKV43_06015, partial [Clostridia bacterium]|nr:hypothetical protein [Clostridia bacterium]
MYIGKILNGITPEFFRGGTDIRLNATPTDGGYKIIWSDIFDGWVEARYNLGGYAYIGAVELSVTGAAKVELTLDGTKIKCNADGLTPVNACGEELVVRMRGRLVDVCLSDASIFGFYPDAAEPFTIPCVKSLTLGEGRVKIGEIFGAGEDGAYAAGFLADSLGERYGFEVGGDGATVTLLVSEEYEAERYTVSVKEDEISVIGGSRLAVLWGACRVIELFDSDSLPAIEIDDKPDVPMRGFHMGLPRADRIDFI